jgi:hypothetical protein
MNRTSGVKAELRESIEELPRIPSSAPGDGRRIKLKILLPEFTVL